MKSIKAKSPDGKRCNILNCHKELNSHKEHGECVAGTSRNSSAINGSEINKQGMKRTSNECVRYL